MGKQENVAPPQVVETGGGGGDDSSVYLNGDEGMHSSEEETKIGEVNQIVDYKKRNLSNRDAGFTTVTFDNHKIDPTGEGSPNPTNVRLENGSKSNHFSEGFIENENSSELKIKENVQFSLVKTSRVSPEVDLEKVLEEQETHDLYCPNCNSCITKRVILRKRKRTIRDVQHGAPPVEFQQVQQDRDGITGSAQVNELGQDREPDVFRCLSCFSFFIPTESGFNILRFFGKREDNEILQTSEQPTVKNVSWISSIFKPVRNVMKESGTGVPLPVGSSPTTYSIREEKHGEGQSTIRNDAEPWESFINGEELVDGPAKEKEKTRSPAKTNSEVVNLGQSQTTTGKGVIVAQPPKESETGGEDGDATYIYQYSTTTTSTSGFIVHDSQINVGRKQNDLLKKNGEEINLPVSDMSPTFPEGASEISQSIHGSVPQATIVSTHSETQIYVGDPQVRKSGSKIEWDVLKSIVYGGLTESITSLGVVSSAAGTDAATLKIVALGLANLIGGLFVIAHNISDLRSIPEQATNSNAEPVGRYWELLGRKVNFRRHAIVAVLTYIISGLLPPVIYGFSFRESNNKEYKIIAVAVASFMFIALLAIGKAHVRPQKGYIKSLSYYLALGVSSSGLSYVAGVMIDRLIVQLGLFDNGAVAPSPPSIMLHHINSMLDGWASS